MFRQAVTKVARKSFGRGFHDTLRVVLARQSRKKPPHAAFVGPAKNRRRLLLGRGVLFGRRVGRAGVPCSAGSVVDFTTMNRDFLGGFYAEANFVATNLDDDNVMSLLMTLLSFFLRDSNQHDSKILLRMFRLPGLAYLL